VRAVRPTWSAAILMVGCRSFQTELVDDVTVGKALRDATSENPRRLLIWRGH
jgi:hypothetical protein